MNNETRTAVYLRDRTTMTPAQRGRVRKHAHDTERVIRQGRIRRVFLTREAKRLRREGANLVAAVRSGYFRRPKSVEREAA